MTVDAGIKDDPEAMKALRYLRSKGYTAKHIEESYRRLLTREAELARSHIEDWADTGGGE